MVYNLSLIANQSSMIPMLQTVDSELMFGYFGLFALVTVFLIFFMAFYLATQKPEKALPGALFVALFTNIVFVIIDIINPTTLWFTAISLALALGFGWASND